MIKKIFPFTILLLLVFKGFTQPDAGFLQTDSLKKILSTSTQDTSRVLIMKNLAEAYRWSNPDSAIHYGQEALALAKRINFPKGECTAMLSISVVQRELGNLPGAMNLALKALKIAQDYNLVEEEINALFRIANVYTASKDYDKALINYRLAKKKAMASESNFQLFVSNFLMAKVFDQMDNLDSLQYYAQLIYSEALNYKLVNPGIYELLGVLQTKLKNESGAIAYFRLGINEAIKLSDLRTAANLYIEVATFYQKNNQPDSAIYYAKQALKTAQILSYQNRIMNASKILIDLYESKNPADELYYYKIYSTARDSLYSIEKMQAMESINFNEQQRQYEIETAKNEFRNRLRMNAILGITFTLLVVAIFLYIITRRKQKAKQKIESAYDQLKSAQAQLIQSEKMASLGELTAGIAHEIQNPLNFVNNFSEVNAEMIDEMQEELKAGEIEEAIAISNDIKENEQKINHHGKRADAIVKGMLQHSRTSTGQKELTDINALADEYLRLSYHGLRAKDKSFNADFKTEFDESLPKINVIPQDIGRVLLNLINNAFYVVDKKAKENIAGYKPLVLVKTSSYKSPSGDLGVKIQVIDNGPGIPDSIKNKIFQPFFTTKSTGEGTGLGLSLSYDIVNAHGGKLRIESTKDEGSEFIIQIPIS